MKFNKWRGLENAVLSWDKTNEAVMEETLCPHFIIGSFKEEVLVVDVPLELILREGSFQVDLNPSVSARKTKPVIAK